MTDNRYDRDDTVVTDSGEVYGDTAVRHGIDNDPNNDAEKGAALGGLGGAVVGAVAGSMVGPVGTIVGGLIGAAGGAGGSALGVAAVDRVDNDNTVSGVGKTDRTDPAYNTVDDDEFATVGTKGGVYSADDAADLDDVDELDDDVADPVE